MEAQKLNNLFRGSSSEITMGSPLIIIIFTHFMPYTSRQGRAVDFVTQRSPHLINSFLECASSSLIIDLKPRRDEGYFWIAHFLSSSGHKFPWNSASQTKDRVKAKLFSSVQTVLIINQQ